MSAPAGLTAELVRRYDVPAPRYTSYPTHPTWSEDFGPDDLGRALDAASRDAGPLSLYVHLPFCERMCSFCGCNVVIAKDRSRADAYLDDVARELDLVRARLGARSTLAQIHWGGGTPTFLVERQLERLWREITERFTVAPAAEVALEVNPATTRDEQLTLVRSLGFNRVSMGVQDVEPAVQEAIGRPQGLEQTRALIEHARRLGFTGVNLDLIYGLPRQTLASWSRTVETILGLAPDRLAVYSFAFVPEARPHQRALAGHERLEGDAKLALFRQAYESLTAVGYRAIGMDHFALPTDELARAQDDRRLGRNFQGYTVTAARDTVAVGVTAISDVGGAYAQNVRPLGRHRTAVTAGRFATERGCWLTDDDRRRRAAITQLLCNFWLDLGADGYFEAERGELRALERDGLLVLGERDVELTPLGRFFVRNVATVFDAHLRRAEGGRAFSRAV